MYAITSSLRFVLGTKRTASVPTICRKCLTVLTTKIGIPSENRSLFVVKIRDLWPSRLLSWTVSPSICLLLLPKILACARSVVLLNIFLDEKIRYCTQSSSDADDDKWFSAEFPDPWIWILHSRMQHISTAQSKTPHRSDAISAHVFAIRIGELCKGY